MEQDTRWAVTHIKDEDGMSILKSNFPDGEANGMNFVLFSTSGVHGSYTTMEEIELAFPNAGTLPDGEYLRLLTFVIIRPRVLSLLYGNCEPMELGDFVFLRKLRQSSWDAILTVGKAE